MDKKAQETMSTKKSMKVLIIVIVTLMFIGVVTLIVINMLRKFLG